MSVCLHRLFHAWEAVQVELHGRYSLPRFQELLAHAASSSTSKNLTIILTVPVPGVLLMLAFDMTPLEPASVGVAKQTPWLFIRTWITSLLTSLMITRNVHVSVPSLPRSTCQFALMGAIPATATIAVFAALGEFWVFPTPFGIQIAEIANILTTFTLWWWAWGNAVRRDPEAKSRAQRFGQAIQAQLNTFPAYLIYFSAFTLTEKTHYQTFVAFTLPLLKMLFKNLIQKGVYYIEDLAPVIIVLSIDAFHAGFVCTTIQQTHGLTAIVFIVTVDCIQSLIAFYEVIAIVRRVNQAAKSSQLLAREKSNVAAHDALGSYTASRLASLLHSEYSAIDYTRKILDTCPRVREHPVVAFPRYLYDPVAEPSNAMSAASLWSRLRVAPSNHLGAPSTDILVRSLSIPPTQQMSRASQLTEVEASQLRCVLETLKMLYMIEFYVLIDYVEAAFAVAYAVYVAIVVHMPNRVYYSQFRDMTDIQLHDAAMQLAVYASLEVLSLVALCVAFNLLLQRVSSFQQLAFVLKKDKGFITTMLAMWVAVIVQITLEHNGLDFTFQFKWMRRPKGP